MGNRGRPFGGTERADRRVTWGPAIDMLGNPSTWHPDGRPNLIGNALHAGNGIFVALVIFGMFASRLEGTDYVGIAHIGLICAALVVMSFGKPGRNSALYHWSIACGLMVLTIASALCPVAVRASASQQAAGARYCIYLNHSRHFALDARDLMFLGWHRGSGDAHATLIIMGEDGPIYGNWSFRQRAFMVPWDVRGHPPTLTCPH